MRNFAKRSLSLLLALALCLSLAAGIRFTAAAASYVSNWGQRGTVATSLSTYATSFYSKAGVTYSSLAALSGASSVSSVPSSAMFKKLQTVMTTYHTYETGYEETKGLYKYTDCQNSSTSKLTCIYCGTSYSSTWPTGGDPWNREHTWPKSKSLDGNDSAIDMVDEGDIMLLRPCCMGENTSRSNTAYGTGSSYFYPNLGSYDVRGDIARSMLYGYVRYGNTTYMWGTSGVIQNLTVLLEWMEADPVDTWELGRNDAVQSITGTRNVFVDYPELGFLMFNRSVPANYQTPSGSGTASGPVTLRFMENGTLTTTTQVDGGSDFTMPANTKVPADGYGFAGWVTRSVSETSSKPSAVYAPGSTFTAQDQTFYALYVRVDTSTGTGKVYTKHSGKITAGDYVVAYTDSNGTAAMQATVSNNRLTYQMVSVSNDMITDPGSSLIWYISSYSNYYTLRNNGYYLAATTASTNNKVELSDAVSDYARWSVDGTESYDFINKANSRCLRKNSTYGFSCYSSSTGGSLNVYKATTGTAYYSTTFVDVCSHTSTTTTTVNATCTQSGSITVSCKSCSEVLSVSVIDPTGHSYSGGVCTGCGDIQPGSGNTSTDNYVLVTPETATAGNYIFGAVRDGAYPTVYPATASVSGDWTVSSTAVTAQDDEIAASQLPADAQVMILTGDNENGFTVGINVNGTMKYLGYTSTTTSRKLALGTQYSTTLWKIVADPDGGVALASSYGEKSYTISQNTTSVTAIRGYYTGTIYTGIYLFRQGQKQPVAAVCQAGAELSTYTTLKEAVSNCGQGQYVKLLSDAEESLTVTGDLHMDLNGYKLTNLTVTGTFYGSDSSATKVAAGTGSATVTGTVAKDSVTDSVRYIPLHANGTYTFHVLELMLTAVSLRTSQAGVYYRATVYCDPDLSASIAAHGVALSVENMPGADFVTQASASFTVTTGAPVNGEVFTSGSVFGIFKKNVSNNADRGKTKIYANAYLQLTDGTILMADTTWGDTVTDADFDGTAWSLYDVITHLDSIYPQLASAEQTALRNFYSTWAQYGMNAWSGDLTYIDT